MGTRALIIGKDKDGNIRYGQTHYDGYANTDWLNMHMLGIEKVENFLKYLTEGGADGNGHGISSLSYKRDYDVDNQVVIRHDDKPVVNWYEESYNCGIVKEWDYTYEEVSKMFDFPEYISLWLGEMWFDFEVNPEDYKIFMEVLTKGEENA